MTLKIVQEIIPKNSTSTKELSRKVRYAMLGASYLEDNGMKFKRAAKFHSGINVPVNDGKII